ncbi:hypothetical protein [Bacillus sp. 7894-2]|uniref:hypothetical protein n=1 Tax=Bacillus sp. 7894-2 TaxID=2021695 RepID=UPI000BA7D0AC|nr:hypothetical protein [Bacillus sp. 7894-2]PAE26688.1 hypothetical protein CHI10_01520 [Bacillus sp. 7894-2]
MSVYEDENGKENSLHRVFMRRTKSAERKGNQSPESFHDEKNSKEKKTLGIKRVKLKLSPNSPPLPNLG